MAWRIEFSPLAEKALAKLDRQIAQRILRFLNERVALLDDPRQIARNLVQQLAASVSAANSSLVAMP